LLAFREGADYDSVNYRWFAERYERFLYIDRVVVSGRARAGGLGGALYRHVFTQAAQAGVPLLTCEFDLDPPNPASERFHRKFGFHEVGRQALYGGAKLVSLQVAMIDTQGAAA
jgi:predicted GNAT superfamily acetyltransferase